MLLIGLGLRVGTTELVALLNTAASILAIVTITVSSLDKVYSLRTEMAYFSVTLSVPSTIIPKM